MTGRIKLNSWTISADSEDYADDFLESVFFCGNGRMGARGYIPFEPQGRSVQRGLFVAGIFGEIKAGITDFVNLPTPIWEELYIDGEPARLSSEIHRELKLADGEFTASFSMEAAGKSLSLTYSRFFSMSNTALLLQKTEILANDDMLISLRSGLYTDSVNCPVPDDQTKDNPETVRLAQAIGAQSLEKGFAQRFEIVGTKLICDMETSFDCDAWDISKQSENALCFERHLKPGEVCVLEKQCCITSSRDVDTRITPPAGLSYDEEKALSDAAWCKKWSSCSFSDNVWHADELCALRYNAFQLFASCSSKDSSVSIGARGLTHTRYKGCYFWDTDMFMLPFFLSADMEAAKNLCLYRYNNLPAARALSKKLNTYGARFPWMCSFDGSEQCETWDIGLSELHVSADVAYALASYCEQSGDEEFRLSCADELWVETARFWRSRYTWNERKKQFDLLFCKGPDEYCGVANNNLYTNVMVQYNLELAICAAEELLKKRPELCVRLGLSEDEIRDWQFFHDSIPWARDPYTGELSSDDSFHLLESVDIEKLKNGDAAAYHEICFDRLQRYKVVKQADVLLLMSRLPDRFSREEKLRAWQDFEPICLHDSTLSFASHALFAAMNGIPKCEYYFKKALFLDLFDVMKNTGKEGLHLACMGETLQAAAWISKYRSSQHGLC